MDSRHPDQTGQTALDEFDQPDKSLLCHFVNEDKPAIEKGRIGLRLMPGRNSQFRNFKVMTVAQ